MNSVVVIRLAVLLSAVSFAAVRFQRARGRAELSTVSSPGTASTAVTPRGKASTLSADSLLAWSDVVLTRAPFTSEAQAQALPPSATTSPQPTRAMTLVLQGVVGTKSNYSALIAGFPGRPGTVLVNVGDTLSGFTVRRVDATAVLIVDADSSYRLVLRPVTP